MPILPKIFKRARTTSTIDDTGQTHVLSSHILTQPSHYHSLPVPDLRREASLPQLSVLQSNSMTDSSASRNWQIRVNTEYKLLPPTPSPPQESPSDSVVNETKEMWRGIADRDANLSKSEKTVNKISDIAAGAVNVVSSLDEEASDDGIISAVKSVAGNELKSIGSAILDGVPAIMSALETLTKVHPFLEAAYLPFKLIYHQEIERRENDKKRTILFEKIKDIMLILLELKSIPKDDTRNTPEGKPMLSRLASICKDMKKDIEECYNVLDAQEKCHLATKFLKASSWNKKLGSYAVIFVNRHDELVSALSIRTAVTVEETNNNVKKMIDMFSTMLSNQEREMGRWIRQNGGEKEVFKSSEKCAAMIKYEAELVPVRRVVKEKNEQLAVADLQKEYHQDIEGIIQENLEPFSTLFRLCLDDFSKDLTNKIERQGDRVMKYLRGGPRNRIKDKMIFHVWKEQGWKGSAKTRPLVLAIRDYFIERNERSKLRTPPSNGVQKRTINTTSISVKKEDDEDDDPEANINTPLPDSWVTEYLQVKRLRYLQLAVDRDASGFTTISEINAFTDARPQTWSLPRWVAYWTIGWQIFATKYCSEIEDLYAQMMLLRQKIGIQMPGNRRYVDEYIESTWKYVTALTSAIERYDAPAPWLEEKFEDYVKSRERLLEERLEAIQHYIGAPGTVYLVLRGVPIEESIFALLALLLRRHVKKMYLCLRHDIDSKELNEDGDTVRWVVYVAWCRFVDLKEHFQNQQIANLKQTFEWLLCGLFKNYMDWGDWLQSGYYMDSDMTAWSSINVLHDFEETDLINILTYTDEKKPVSDMTTNIPPSAGTKNGSDEYNPDLKLNSLFPAAEDSSEGQSSVPKPSAVEMSITGAWFGYHWTDEQNHSPALLAMSCIHLQCGNRSSNFSQEGTALLGNCMSTNGAPWTITGTMGLADQRHGVLTINFERTLIGADSVYRTESSADSVRYTGRFLYNRDILEGTFERPITNGRFLFKKVPESNILLWRPMVPELNIKELWSFACNAILDSIRRKKLGLSYLHARMTDMHRFLHLMHKEDSNMLTEVDKAEYAKVQKTFTFEEASELMGLYMWHNRAGRRQPANPLFFGCDGCDELLTRSRVVCLDCNKREVTGRRTGSIDFCSKPGCIASETFPNRPDVTHLSTHLMLKTRDLLLLKDYFMVKQRAQYCSLSYTRDSDKGIGVISTDIVSPGMERTSSTISEIPSDLPQLDAQSMPDPSQQFPDSTYSASNSMDWIIPSTSVKKHVREALKCIICHESVAAPCWYCIDCYDASDQWVCDSCEKVIDEMPPWDLQKRFRKEISAAKDGSNHNVFHYLIRIAKPKETQTKVDNGDVINASNDVEHPFGGLKQVEELITKKLFEAVNTRVDKLQEEVESRLTNIERILTTLAAQQK